MTVCLCIYEGLKAHSSDKPLLNCKGKYTKSELGSDVSTGLCVPPSATVSNVHALHHIYDGSWDPYRLALLPYDFEHQFNSCLLCFCRSSEISFKCCPGFLGSLNSEALFSVSQMSPAVNFPTVFAEIMVQKQRTGIFERNSTLPVQQQWGVPAFWLCLTSTRNKSKKLHKAIVVIQEI